MASLLRNLALMTAVSTLAIASAPDVMASPHTSAAGFDVKQRSSVLRDFGDVRGIGDFSVVRDSYDQTRDGVEFEAIVNGDREQWWADCRREQLGTGRWNAPRNSETTEITDFVCNDGYAAGNGSSVDGSDGWSTARVTQETDGVSANGRALFSFFEGEQIQIDWANRRTINGREYVAAVDSVGQEGYIRTDRIERRGNGGGVIGRPVRPSQNRWETASASRETPAVSSNGRELFYFFEGEQIQVNWGDRRTINGREYVAAVDSVGQEGYIQVAHVRGSRPGNGSGTGNVRPGREQWQRATVRQETPGLSEDGEELFYFYEDEEIQINRSDVVRIDGRDYVEALDSVGQRGYIRVDRVR